MLLLGYDIGSSSIKASLLDAADGRLLASATSPATELPIDTPQSGWAEQHPQLWWDHLKAATAQIRADSPVSLADARTIGISYQMHGLVLVDKDFNVLRPAIIWCDSRAVQIGNQASEDIGPDVCLQRLLNFPGNFTASKLKWVQLNEPDTYARIHKMMLPGDYIAARLTGQVATTPSGLSEGIMWNFQEKGLARLVLDHYGISPELIPPVLPTFSSQGRLTKQAADELGLSPKGRNHLSRRRPDQQRPVTQRPGARRYRHHGRHLWRRLRHNRSAQIRPPIPRQQLRPRQLHPPRTPTTPCCSASTARASSTVGSSTIPPADWTTTSSMNLPPKRLSAAMVWSSCPTATEPSEH